MTTIDSGMTHGTNGTPPPEVPLSDIDLGSLEFWSWDDDRRDGAFATLRREAPIAFFEALRIPGFESGPGHWAGGERAAAHTRWRLAGDDVQHDTRRAVQQSWPILAQSWPHFGPTEAQARRKYFGEVRVLGALACGDVSGPGWDRTSDLPRVKRQE